MINTAVIARRALARRGDLMKSSSYGRLPRPFGARNDKNRNSLRKVKILILTITAYILCGIPAGFAADLATSVQEHYSQVEYIQANFIQDTYIELLERNQTRTGKLYIGHNRFRIDYLKPEKQSYIFNGETLWIYSPKFKEVEIYPDADQRISREALNFLSGLDTLKSTFKIPKTQTLNEHAVLTLIPKDKNSRLKKIRLTVDKKDYELKEATLWPKQGNRSHYQFSHLKLDKKVSDKLFNFKVPRNVSVIRQDN
jgi:outer membrane lipoprotein carrier protein